MYVCNKRTNKMALRKDQIYLNLIIDGNINMMCTSKNTFQTTLFDFKEGK